MLVLPDEGEPLLFGQVVDSDLFQQSILYASTRSKHVYLKSNFDLLGQGTLREDGLNLWHNSAVDHTAFGSNRMDFLPDPGHDSKVLREVSGQDPGDSVGVQILKLAQFCKKIGSNSE